MLQLKTLVLYCGLLAIIVCHFQVAAKKDPKPEPEPVDDDCPEDEDDRDGELCKDFQFLRDLIDVDALMDLIQFHYQCDVKFRKAVCYYKTSRFDQIIEQLQQSEAYHTLIHELRKAGINTTDIDSISAIFECFEVPIMPVMSASKKYNCRDLRGHTFIGDLLALMPHQKVREFSSSSLARHTNFGLFRQTVTSPEFQAKLRSNLQKRDAARALNVLRRNGWDVPELLRGALSILSW